MKNKFENAERIDRYLINEEGTPSEALTERTLERIRQRRQTTSLPSPFRFILPLAACLAAAFFLPDFFNGNETAKTSGTDGKETSGVVLPSVPSSDEPYFDDILLLAEPFEREIPLLDEQTIDLFAMLTENLED
ncbi:hypothetical protein N9D63_03745 [Opitutales bacterium]|nr:hypothetical protein [Opitutales bacterium]